MIGAVASTINNIGGCMAIGAASGLISGFWIQIINPKINKNNTYDNLGIFGPILVCSTLGGLGLSPILYQIYSSLNISTVNLEGTISDSTLIFYQIANFGIAAGIASITGVIAGLLSYPFRESDTDFS